MKVWILQSKHGPEPANHKAEDPDPNKGYHHEMKDFINEITVKPREILSEHKTPSPDLKYDTVTIPVFKVPKRETFDDWIDNFSKPVPKNK